MVFRVGSNKFNTKVKIAAETYEKRLADIVTTVCYRKVDDVFDRYKYQQAIIAFNTPNFRLPEIANATNHLYNVICYHFSYPSINIKRFYNRLSKFKGV